MGGVSYCGANPGWDQRFSMEAPPNFQLDEGQTLYFLSGIMLGFMGVLGLYLGRVFDEVKRRPLYVIRARTWHD
jgi:hypothetical protein